MKIIGMTGGSGAGKGIAGALFRSFGCVVVDTDALYHGMIESDSPCSRALIMRFGIGISNENGGIERPRLAQIVFKDPEALTALNKIAHGYIREKCESMIEEERQKGTEVIILDAPQLFESGIDSICDATVAVVADRQTRVRRISERDGISEEKALERLSVQHTDAFFCDNCDYIINNDTDVAHLLVNVKCVLDKIRNGD